MAARFFASNWLKGASVAPAGPPSDLLVDQDAGVEDPGGVDRGLGAAQRRREGLGALAVVPGPVVAADRVVVGDRARPRR